MKPAKLEANQHTVFMAEALTAARLGATQGEVPIGSVIVVDGTVVARAHNEIEQRQDATAHAEMLAIKMASETVGSWRLTSATLYVTVEPCIMCVGAIRLSRIPLIVYAAGDSRFGALGSVVDLAAISAIGPVPTVVSGVMEAEGSLLLKSFFRARRAS